MAICLEARAQADAELRKVTLERGDIGLALERYQQQLPALKTFCAYALQVGPPA